MMYPHTSDEFVCPRTSLTAGPANFTTYNPATGLGRIINPPGPVSLTSGQDDMESPHKLLRQ